MHNITSIANNTGFRPVLGSYKGIVIDNHDTVIEHSGRVQIFVPDVQGVDITQLYGEQTTFSFKFPGNNITTSLTPNVLNYLRGVCPWAVPAMPMIGSVGPGIYDGTTGEARLVDDVSGSSPTGTKPATIYEKTNVNSFSSPGTYMLARGDAHGREFLSPSFSNKPKGSFSIPRVGAQLLISFLQGDVNFPVYHGYMPGVKDVEEIYRKGGNFESYPGGYESLIDLSKEKGPVKDVNANPPQPNVNLNAKQLRN